jgi:hypothetical protein
MRDFWRGVVEAIRRVDAQDIHIYGGLAMMGVGIGWWIHPAAGLVLPGALLLWLATRKVG